MLDIKTIIFSYAISNVICTVGIGFLWWQNRKRFNGLGFWLADFILHCLAIICAAARGTVPDFVSLVLPSVFVVTGALLMLMGLECYVGKPSKQWHNFILLGVFACIQLWFTLVVRNILVYTVSFSLVLIAIVSQSAWLALRRVGSELRLTTRGMGGVFVIGCIIAAVRIVVNVVINPGSDILQFEPYGAWYVLANQMLFVVLTFNLFLMVNRRVVSELAYEVKTSKEAEESISGSEKRYRSLFENMIDGFAYCQMIYVDGEPRDFMYLEVNTAFEALTGLRNVRGKKLSEVIPGTSESDSSFFRAYHRASISGGTERFEIYVPALGNSWFLISLYSPIPDYFVVIFENITERKNMEDALKASQHLAEALYESAPDALVTIGTHGRITRVNSQTQLMFGYTREELVGQSIEVLIPHSLHAEHKQRREEYFVSPHQLEMGLDQELSGLKKDGSTFPVEIKLSPLQVLGETLVTADIRDITERKRADAELQDSEEKFNVLYNRVPIAAAMSRLTDGVLLDVNHAFEKYFGYSKQDVVGKTTLELGINPDLETREIIRAELQKQGVVHDQEVRILTRSGKPRIFLLNLDVVDIRNEKYILQTAHDITERKVLEESLQRRSAELAALHQVMLDLVNRHDVDDILQTMLSKVSDLLDVSHVSIDLIEDGDMLVTYAVTRGQPLVAGDRMRRGEGGWLSWQAIDNGQPAVLEDYATWPQRRGLYDGFPIHAIAIIPIYQRERVIGAINLLRSKANLPFSETDVYVAKQLAQMAALVLDNAQLYVQLRTEIAERIRNETALQQIQEEVIAQQRTMATFDERQRLARNLHDSVNQSIHSLVLFSETLVFTLEKNNVERARQISERLQESARQALKETRLLLYQMEASSGHSSLDLVSQLKARLANVEQRAGVRTQLTQEGSLDHCPSDWHENLFWITIEALNNALKHAQARSVDVALRCLPESLELSITDNGKGFDTANPGTGGYGLRNMQERARMLGGELTFTSALGQGSSVAFYAKFKE